METKYAGQQDHDPAITQHDGAPGVWLTAVQLQTIAMALEDAIAYREPDNNCCPDCGEGDALCTSHRSDQDRRDDYWQLVAELESATAATHTRGCLVDPPSDPTRTTGETSSWMTTAPMVQRGGNANSARCSSIPA